MSYEETQEDKQFDEALGRLVDKVPPNFPSVAEWASAEPQDHAEATRAAFSEAGFPYSGERNVANAVARIGRMVGQHLPTQPEK